MPFVRQAKGHVYIAIADQIFIINTKNGHTERTEVPPMQIPDHLIAKGQLEFLRETPDITSFSISQNNTLVVSTHNKQVVVFNLSNMAIESSFLINRAASKICFDTNEQIIVADKTGDVFLCKSGQEPNLLLGHLSMLLDVIVSPCGQYVITSDRDEKIRVSHYPNCYNIVCYCMGHEEFVTNLAICNNQLLSASGDGLLKLWDFRTGHEIYKINTNEFITDQTIVNVLKEMKSNVNVEAIPITDMQTFQYYDGCALIAVTLFGFKNVLLFEFDFVKQVIVYLGRIDLDGKPTAISLGTKLVVLTENRLNIYDFVTQTKTFELSVQQFNLLDNFKNVFDNYVAKDDDITVLYKRKFDNVQEYLERKKLRLENK